ncbi:MAG TPA: hypothetical protein PKZ76_10320 [Xanthomonadaceae bacterium]|nr:hypothetical protein [Xanthomonadaceae bacterium]
MWRSLSIVVATVLVAGCPQQTREAKMLDETLVLHAQEVRWGGFERSLEFMDPRLLAERPPRTIDLERYRQVVISGFRPRGQPVMVGDQATYVVDIEIYNRHTLATRTIVDRQQWRFDPELKRWWLVSPLPDLQAQ